jgi:hypothetical protein
VFVPVPGSTPNTPVLTACRMGFPAILRMLLQVRRVSTPRWRWGLAPCVCLRVHVCVCLCACMCVCVCAAVCAYVCARPCV